MTDSQPQQTAAQPRIPQTPAQPSAIYQQNLQQWSNSPSATPRGAAASQRPSRNTRARTGHTVPSTPEPSTLPAAFAYQHPPRPVAPAPPRNPLASTTQALHSTYASRMRTGATLLMQPILASTSNAAAAVATTTASSRGTRRGAAVNYVDPGSAEEDAELDSDDSDFVASGGVRTAVRAGLKAAGRLGTSAKHASPAPGGKGKAAGEGEVQSYLGMIPPARLIIAKRVDNPTKHEYFDQEQLEAQATRATALVPIRVEFETETHRVRDCFVWNVHETLISPETFARIFCTDLDLPQTFAETIAAQIRTQLEEHEAIASMDFGVDYKWMDADVDVGSDDRAAPMDVVDEIPECRVIVAIDVQIGNNHLMDHIEWDLLSPLTPEAFAHQLCAELGLSGESAPLIAHAVHEELVKHKRDAVEWGVIGGDVPSSTGTTAAEVADRAATVLKDKTGLGLGWGKAPKDGKGRGPKTLRSVWRDWAEAEEFATRFEVLTAEEVERREMERERATRRLRRETSKFQSSARSRRR